MVQTTLAPANSPRLNTAQVADRILQALAVLTEPGQVVELRVPGIQGKRTDSGYFTDPQKLARAAMTYQGRAEGVYITLNPLNPALLARSSNRITEYARNTTADKDILYRRWLFVDFDAVRPAGISASDAEHDAALARAAQCRDWLLTKQIPSLLADSGNGGHVLIPINLPNNETSLALVKAVLAAFSAQFSNERVEIDTSTSNAGRIIKLYGTFACKGDNVPDRPYRQAVLLNVPEPLEPLERSLLENLIPSSKNIERLPAASTPIQPSIQSDSLGRDVIDDVKAHFDMVAYAESKLGVSAVQNGSEYRLPGNQGFLINPEKGYWYRHGGQTGGDALDLVGHFRYGSSWSRQDKPMFKAVLREAADLVGATLPKRTRNLRTPTQQSENLEAANPSSEASASPGASPDADTSPVASASIGDLLDLAHVWKARYTDKLAWDLKLGAWRCWTGTHWQPERNPGVLDLLAAEIIRSTGGTITSTQKIDSVIRLARALCSRQFASSRQWINFQNGTLEIGSMVGHLHKTEDGLTECLPYDFVPQGSCAAIERFLVSVMPDAEGRRAYMAHIGLALMGDLTFHKALILLGPPRSGKTTLLKLAQSILGGAPGQFATAVLFSPESRGANSRAAWIDHAPRLVCLDEFPEEALRDEGEELFKSMTAHGGVSMWLKYRDERAENIWTPKLLFATNNRMRYRDPSGALTRRLLIVECPRSLPDERLDSGLLDKFTPELGAFASVCIHIAHEVQQKRAYPESDAMRALLRDIERNGDAAKLWLSENCVFQKDGFIPSRAMYQNFRWWCEENGLHPFSHPKLRDMVLSLHESVHCIRQRAVDPADGTRKLLWGMAGIRLRTSADDQHEHP